MVLLPGIPLLHSGESLDWGSHQGPSSRSPCLGEPSCHLMSLHVGLPPERSVSWLGPLARGLHSILGLSSWPL